MHGGGTTNACKLRGGRMCDGKCATWHGAEVREVGWVGVRKADMCLGRR